MIRKQFALILILWSSLGFTSVVNAQDVKVYEWNDVQSANPDTIYAISFEKNKLTELPEDLSRFINLKELDLSKNKLSDLPSFIGGFDSLEILSLERNKFTKLPIEICQLGALKSLKIGSNDIAAIPDCIEYASNLEFLDLYDNPLGYLPQSVMRLKKLKKIDFTGIRFNKTFQKQWTEQLSNVELVFDSPCDCMN
jgi:Leucine-rich repeat (LRR) protein